MCTAVTTDNFFGRTLDVERTYGESVTVIPRNFSLRFSETPRYAIIGMAFVQENYPLYYDAMNEKGLCMAGLNFPEHAAYFSPQEGKNNIPSYAIIPWVLSRCASVKEAIPLLENLNITDAAFSPKFPPTPLHWLLADAKDAVVLESCADGLHIWENPVGVLTNAPTFPEQQKILQKFSPENRGLGLPGDGTSPARFQRAVYAKDTATDSSVNGFFHMMETVSLPKGFAVVNGLDHYTAYTCCCDRTAGTYYYTTYENRQITGICLRDCALDGSSLLQEEQILRFSKIHSQNKARF